ncbi:MAG: NADP-specific glutamate dehydrogenase GdhA [Candidatus Ratteibacteria bacterium]|jgi:glutamate dehydrogenase
MKRTSIQPGVTIIEQAHICGLDISLLYDSIIEISNEGFFTATCLNAAAHILLTELGLPNYFFQTISKDSLKRVLREIAGNLTIIENQYVLKSAVSEVRLNVDEGVQVRIATRENRDRMEQMLSPIMAGNRVEYYYGMKNHYYTYLIRSEKCPPLDTIGKKDSRFTFSTLSGGSKIPEATRTRYEQFLAKTETKVTPLVEVSSAKPEHETRIMFRDDSSHSILPIVRKILLDAGLILHRAYWETYRGKTGRIESICSIYIDGIPSKTALEQVTNAIRAIFTIKTGNFDSLYISNALTLNEFLFATSAALFVHSFIHKDLSTDHTIIQCLSKKEMREVFAKRIFESDRSEYTRNTVIETIRNHPDMIKDLYKIFDKKFNPAKKVATKKSIEKEIQAFRKTLEIPFADNSTGFDIFSFMTYLVTSVLKTNFYKKEKRSLAFRLDSSALDPIVFSEKVYGTFFVTGFYSIASQMRAEDISRGGLRLIRITPANYENELDAMLLLNYALGPVAQRLKHKDIAESGAKGVVVPYPEYAVEGLNALFDFTEGVFDLILQSKEVVDYLGLPEMIFFGPDEGTGPFMDAVALRARDRKYPHWRSITTGKSSGIPHDTYGMLKDRRVFGLIDEGPSGTTLQIEGKKVFTSSDTSKIFESIGEEIDTSGMTTMGVLSCLRVMLAHAGIQEEKVNLMMTGGPDGDLGANQIQSFKGKISLIVDGGSVLYDPDGLNKKELMKLAFARHTKPRLNTSSYPKKALGPRGFQILRTPEPFTFPNGHTIENGALFHRTFLTNPLIRPYIEEAKITVFVPCGGFKDTINAGNVDAFIQNFKELNIIVEGANVFFDASSREIIARKTSILQLRDSSANKGGVTSSSIAEVLTAFLLGERYEETLVDNPKTRTSFIRAVFDLIRNNGISETEMLLALHTKTGIPLHTLSSATSEQLFSLQDMLNERIDQILQDKDLVEATVAAYVPDALTELLGIKKILASFNAKDLRAYRNALITKKLASMTLYQHAADWDSLLESLKKDFSGTLRTLFS